MSPAWPRRTGNGLAMRAWAVSEAWGRRAAVTFAARRDGLPPPDQMPPNVTAATVELDPPRITDRLRRTIHAVWPSLYPSLYREPADWPRRAGLREQFDPADFDELHVFRLSMVPHAAPFLGRIACRLDLDECESRTRTRIAGLHRQNGHEARARLLEREAEFLAAQERMLLPRFDTIYVSSEGERSYLEAQGLTTAVTILPNTVPIQANVNPPRSEGPPTLLFVGNHHYYPNEDGIRFFIKEVLPTLRRSRGDLRVQIAGRGPAALRKLVRSQAGMEWLGFVPDLETVYRNAHVVVAPVRAGGGTRIKILEAFSHGRALVSTSSGVEGLCAVNGTHFVEAETPAEIASACLRLLDDRHLRDQIAAAAQALVRGSYSPRELEGVI